MYGIDIRVGSFFLEKSDTNNSVLIFPITYHTIFLYIWYIKW